MRAQGVEVGVLLKAHSIINNHIPKLLRKFWPGYSSLLLANKALTGMTNQNRP